METFAALTRALLGQTFGGTPDPAHPKLEIVATLPQSVGNVTFTPDRRTVFTHHPFFKPTIRVAELNADRKSYKPFPNVEWNTPRPGTDEFFASPLGIRADENGIVWVLDMGGPRVKVTPKFVGWNTKTNKVEQIIRIPAPATTPASQLNDFIVDIKNGYFYITDEGTGEKDNGVSGAVVVVNRKTGKSRRVLQGHRSAKAEKLPIVVDGRTLQVPGLFNKPQKMHVGADGIACDKNFEWLYFCPLTGHTVYRVRTSDLRNEGLTNTELGRRVEVYARKPNSGGMTLDNDGNLYFTQVEDRTVGIIPAGKKDYRTYVKDAKLWWPDGISFAPDGFMYVSASQVGWAAGTNGGKDLSRKPFYIFRFAPLAPGRVGF